MNVGFIGTGSMGSLLVEAFLVSGRLRPEQVWVTNRTLAKAYALSERFPGVRVAPNAEQVAHTCDRMFVCVKPLEYSDVLDCIANCLRPEQWLISITSPVSVADLEALLHAKVAKVIPSITNGALSGALLVVRGSRFSDADHRELLDWLHAIGHPVEIDERWTRIASDLSSCGPAFLSFLLQEMAEAATRETGLPKPLATELVTEMAIGFGRLLATGTFTLEALRQRVCVPGGVTGAGLAVLEAETRGTFDRLYRRTRQKFEEDVEQVRQRFHRLAPRPSDAEPPS
ncbi:MAG: late competence protein ComER [Calditerricola sp.]|jgi:Pyrroline-5-carboxylate reductase|nr:late competence protein ComER [Bacillota bacterium]MCG0314568.1 late competence protein ComER [Calditerricola sp.]